ncbi:MAG: calcium/sodium antiporter [Puniceicoccales bacterium]|jgi:cation:H+ antiporter|nr:calcium/sodium antiporter [Puniceicoccales bacterium]
MFWSLFLIIFGFILLIYGGNYVCSGASALAVRLGISQFIIGMTIVAISTSAPEFITSVIAVINGHREIVMGNVIGSNLVNIGLAGGLVALIKPFTITSSVIKREAFLLLLVTLGFGLCSILSSIGWIIGLLFIILNILYLYFVCKNDRGINKDEEISQKMALEIDLWGALKIFLFGLFLLLLGAQLVVQYSVEVARALGWSDAFIGFTIIAIGTSFPEIATSLVAAFRGYGSICTGNIIGSNIFNTLMIIGSCSIIHPLPIDDQLRHFAIPSLIGLTALVWHFFTEKRKIGPYEGFILLVVYLIILLKLISKEINFSQ